MSSDSYRPPKPIKGDVDLNSIRRVSGTPGKADGLIELRLVGYPYRYRVRVEMDNLHVAHVELGGTAPRLVELHILPLDDTPPAEISPTTIRQVPVRRLASAAARWIWTSDGAFTGVEQMRNPTYELRPDRAPDGGKRRRLDDVHYRQVAEVLMEGRIIGESPREYASERLKATIPTLDRWIAESKRRGFLPRDWAANDSSTTDDQEID